MDKYWFEEYPDRYEKELKSLDEAGILFEIDEGLKKRGYLRLNLEVPFKEKILFLIASFPFNYPYFRPQVQAPDNNLPRHQHPFGKNLCLLPRPTRYWEIKWTLAEYLENQLEKVMETGVITDLEKISEKEYEQAEPFSDYYLYESDTTVFIDSKFEIDEGIKEGKMVIGFLDNPFIKPKVALLKVKDCKGNILHKLPEEIRKYFKRECEFNWFHLDEPLKTTNANDALKLLWKDGREVKDPKSKLVQVNGGQIDNVVGIAFPEEHNLKKKGTGWTFLFTVRKEKKESYSFFSPAKRVGKEDIFARIPELITLQDKKISIVGLGCLGAPSAIEFAKSGVGNLYLLDHDTVDPATIVRWPLGIQSSGSSKTQQIGDFIYANYPYSSVEGGIFKLGGTIDELTENDNDKNIITSFLKNTSLIYDATAELGVSHYLSRMSEEKEIPFIGIYGTNNGWGGVAFRIVPGKTEGCWMCFRHAIMDDSIPLPAEDGSEFIQPLGCADPTFTGSSFDLMNITLAGVRLAASTLCSDSEKGYPDMDWDVGILSLRNEDGIPIAPTLETFSLNKHPKCPYCN